MSDPVTNVQIEDVLSSIRRLVSEENRTPPQPAYEPEADDRLVLTEALRVADAEPDEVETGGIASTARKTASQQTADPVPQGAPWADPGATLYDAAADAGQPIKENLPERSVSAPPLVLQNPASIVPSGSAEPIEAIEPVETEPEAANEPGDLSRPAVDHLEFLRPRKPEAVSDNGQDPAEADEQTDASDAERHAWTEPEFSDDYLAFDAHDADVSSPDSAPDGSSDEGAALEDEPGDETDPSPLSEVSMLEQARELAAETADDPTAIKDERQPEDRIEDATAVRDVLTLEGPLPTEPEEVAPDATVINAPPESTVEAHPAMDTDTEKAEAPTDAIESLSAKIEALEAAVSAVEDDFEPAEADETDYAGTTVRTMAWKEEGQMGDTPLEPATTAPASELGSLDEESLRELVADIVRQELQGALGERITRNVRKLVRREIHRALTAQEFE